MNSFWPSATFPPLGRKSAGGVLLVVEDDMAFSPTCVGLFGANVKAK